MAEDQVATEGGRIDTRDALVSKDPKTGVDPIHRSIGSYDGVQVMPRGLNRLITGCRKCHLLSKTSNINNIHQGKVGSINFEHSVTPLSAEQEISKDNRHCWNGQVIQVMEWQRLDDSRCQCDDRQSRQVICQAAMKNSGGNVDAKNKKAEQPATGKHSSRPGPRFI